MSRKQYAPVSPTSPLPTISQALDLLKRVFGQDWQPSLHASRSSMKFSNLSARSIQRAMDMQEIAEHCCTELHQRLLIGGHWPICIEYNSTEPSAQLQARFFVDGSALGRGRREASSVRRFFAEGQSKSLPSQKCHGAQTIRAKWLATSRILASRPATTTMSLFLVADYPLLPTRRRFWEKVLRNGHGSLGHQGPIALSVADCIRGCPPDGRIPRPGRQPRSFPGRFHLRSNFDRSPKLRRTGTSNMTRSSAPSNVTNH